MLLDHVTDQVTAWLKERRDAHPDKKKRPFFLAIRNEEGQVLRALEITPLEEVEDVTDREQDKPLQPRPKLNDGDIWMPPS
ncbi:hypothetical protein [Georgenia sp. AZ-5]|uniref:hypothetical protein n=1 Tax=Georgenia sp. AZ-5 TaxID=3367526 RepID=UPI0037541D04